MNELIIAILGSTMGLILYRFFVQKNAVSTDKKLEEQVKRIEKEVDNIDKQIDSIQKEDKQIIKEGEEKKNENNVQDILDFFNKSK
jgi:peptidoglycan hydrolase CwlO-like protein